MRGDPENIYDIGLGKRLAQYDFFFFKDPKYFRIFPQSVNITNNLNKLTMIKVNIIVFKIILS